MKTRRWLPKSHTGFYFSNKKSLAFPARLFFMSPTFMPHAMNALKDRIVLATTNAGKAREFEALLPGLKILTLQDVGFLDTIEEPFDSFEQNARVKAETVFKATGIPSLADDSGLCVAARGGAPGVHSARYAGEPASSERNMTKLLDELKGADNRSAYFIAVLCFFDANGPRYFEGRCNGSIAYQASGSGGFGYDPVFIPEGYHQSFGELPPTVKAEISHRAKALAKLKEHFAESGHNA